MTEAHLKLIKLGFVHEAIAYVVKHNLLREFITNTTADCGKPLYMALLYIPTWCESHDYVQTDIINQAFSWAGTKEGLGFWYDVSNNFNRCCSMNAKNIAKQDKLSPMNVTLTYGTI